MSLTDDLDSLLDVHRCATCEWRSGRTEKEQQQVDERMRVICSNDRRKVYGQFTELYKICSRHGLVATLDAFRHHCRNHVAH